MNKKECEKAVEKICELCKEKHEVLYGYKGLACAFRAFDNTDCDKVRVFKQLIKEHFELVEAYDELKEAFYGVASSLNNTLDNILDNISDTEEIEE